MNQIFSFKRYILLMKRQFAENKRLYLWGTGGVLAIIVLFFWSISSIIAKSQFYQEAVLTISAYLCLTFYAGTFHEQLGIKRKRMFYYSLPASPLERLAVAFSYVMVLCPVVFIVLFYTADFFAIQIFNSANGTNFPIISIFTYRWDVIYHIVLLMSVFAVCSFSFGTAGIIKTTFAVFVVGLMFIGLYMWLFKSLFQIKDASVILPYASLYLYADDTMLKANNIFSRTWFLLAPLCWVIYYFKLKEKEA